MERDKRVRLFVRASELSVLAGMSRFASKTTLAYEILARKPPKHNNNLNSNNNHTNITSSPSLSTNTTAPTAPANSVVTNLSSHAYNSCKTVSVLQYNQQQRAAHPAFKHGLFALQKNTPLRTARNIQGDYANAIGVADELQATIRVWRRLQEHKRTESTMAHLAEAVLEKYREKHRLNTEVSSSSSSSLSSSSSSYLPVHPDMVRRLVLCCLRKVSGNDHEPEAIARFCKASRMQVTRFQEEIKFILALPQTCTVDVGVANDNDNDNDNNSENGGIVKGISNDNSKIDVIDIHVSGRVDGVAVTACGNESVLEVKTYTRRGLTPHIAPKEHVIQVHAYMHALGYKSAILLYSSHRTQSVVRVFWDQQLWDDVCSRVMSCLCDARLSSFKVN